MTPLAVACQIPLSIEFSGQECWSGLLFSSPGGLPHPEIEPRSLPLQADCLPSEQPGKPLPNQNKCQIKLMILRHVYWRNGSTYYPMKKAKPKVPLGRKRMNERANVDSVKQTFIAHSCCKESLHLYFTLSQKKNEIGICKVFSFSCFCCMAKKQFLFLITTKLAGRK